MLKNNQSFCKKDNKNDEEKLKEELETINNIRPNVTNLLLYRFMKPRLISR